MLINIIYGIVFGAAVYFFINYILSRRALNTMNYIEVRNAQIEEDIRNERKLPLNKKIQLYLSNFGYSGNYLPLLTGITLLYLLSSLILTIIGVGDFVGLLLSLPLSTGLTLLTLSTLKKKSISRFERQLLQVLGSVVNYLEAGDVPTMAFHKAVRLVDDPLRTTFERALATKIGNETLATVLQPIADEYPSKSMTMLITALQIDDKMGAKLAPALRQAVKILERQFELSEEGKAEIAQAKSEFYAISGILASIAMTLIVGNGQMTRSAYTSPLGLVVLTLAVANYGFGVYRALKIFAKAARI